MNDDLSHKSERRDVQKISSGCNGCEATAKQVNQEGSELGGDFAVGQGGRRATGMVAQQHP
jgi:hypothetical protein